MSHNIFAHTPVPLKSYVPPVTTDGCESSSTESTLLRERHKAPQPSFLGATDTQDPALHVRWHLCSSVQGFSGWPLPGLGFRCSCTPRGKYFPTAASQETKTESQMTTGGLQTSTGEKPLQQAPVFFVFLFSFCI